MATCVLTMRLFPEKWQYDLLMKRFRCGEQIKNATIREVKAIWEKLQSSPEWIANQKVIAEELEKQEAGKKSTTKSGKLKKKASKPRVSPQLKEAYSLRNEMIKSTGLTQYGIEDIAMKHGKHFAAHIATTVAQRIGTDVSKGMESVLYHGGKALHYVKKGEMRTLSSKNSTSPIKYYPELNILAWNPGKKGGNPNLAYAKKKTLPIGKDRDGKDIKGTKRHLCIKVAEPATDYEREMLKKPIKYFTISRKWVGKSYHWYVQFVLAGTPYIKSTQPVGTGRVGIDLGVQTIAVVSNAAVNFTEIAPDIDPEWEKRAEILDAMDRSRRAMNPQKYLPDGQIDKSNRDKWICSKRYRVLRAKLRNGARHRADKLKNFHENYANYVVSLGSDIFIENMDYKELQKREEETKQDEQGRYLDKSKFGKSLGNKGPAALKNTIIRKVASKHSGTVTEVDKYKFRASQLDHTNGEYHKAELGERVKTLSDGTVVQRDLYSAYLLKNAVYHSEAVPPVEPDIDKCHEGFKDFLRMQDEAMDHLRCAVPAERRLSSMGIEEFANERLLLSEEGMVAY